MKFKKYDSINVVPFIDIILVLLVIVLTTASFIAKGLIPVDLSSAKSSIKKQNQKSLIITIKSDGGIFLDKQKIELFTLSEKLKEYKNSKPIELNCDKKAKFDNFVIVLNELKKQNFKNLSIITEYEK